MGQDFRVHPEIFRMRKRIDAIDKKILKLFKLRFQSLERLARAKLISDMPIEDTDREAKILKRWKKLFRGVKAEPEFLEDLFELVVDSSKKTQEMYHHKNIK